MANRVLCLFIPTHPDGSVAGQPIKAHLTPDGNMVSFNYKGSIGKYYVDGKHSVYMYMLDKPEPITSNNTPMTAKQMRTLVDSQWMHYLMRAALRPRSNPVRAFLRGLWYGIQFWRDEENDKFWSDHGQWTDEAKHWKGWLGDQIADYIEQEGIEDGDFIVITKKMVENIRQGGSNGK